MELFLLKASIVLLWFSQACHGEVLFSSLPQALFVFASPKEGQILKAGENTITVSWGLNQSVLAEGTDLSYKEVKVKLCYAPVSQVDRGWRRTDDDLSKDKTCQFTIAQTTYKENTQNVTWKIEKDVPSASYFVRAYAYNSAGNEAAYGQTTNDKKDSNIFQIQAISGRHVSLDIASICFSVFALLSAVGFFLVEKWARRSTEK